MTPRMCPPGFRAFGVFLVFSAILATYAGSTLAYPGTLLDRAWVINRPAHQQLLQFGRGIGGAFFALAILMVFAAVGWFRRRRWGWALGTGVVAVNILGDFINSFRGEPLRSALGIAIAGSLLIYLTHPRVREYFHT